MFHFMNRAALRMILGVGLAAVVTRPAPTHAMCCPMPCDGCQLLSQGQMNFVRMERATGLVHLIPNIRISGDAADFALVIPTPTEPALTPAAKGIWSALIGLTAPVASSRTSGNFSGGCTRSSDVFSPPATADVNVIRQQTVGGFRATIVQSTSADALVNYLRQGGIPVTPGEAAAFQPYTSRGWVFTVMRLDTSKPGTTVPPNGWDNNVDPVELTYASPTLEVPLDILAINRAGFLPMVFFVVDEHRTTLPGFATLYANRLTTAEAAAIAGSYPDLAGWLVAGCTLTRLDRSWFASEPMSGSLTLVNAPNDEEFRRIRGVNQSGMPIEWLLWLGLPGLGGALARRRGKG